MDNITFKGMADGSRMAANRRPSKPDSPTSVTSSPSIERPESIVVYVTY